MTKIKQAAQLTVVITRPALRRRGQISLQQTSTPVTEAKLSKPRESSKTTGPLSQDTSGTRLGKACLCRAPTPARDRPYPRAWSLPRPPELPGPAASRLPPRLPPSWQCCSPNLPSPGETPPGPQKPPTTPRAPSPPRQGLVAPVQHCPTPGPSSGLTPRPRLRDPFPRPHPTLSLTGKLPRAHL